MLKTPWGFKGRRQFYAAALPRKDKPIASGSIATRQVG